VAARGREKKGEKAKKPRRSAELFVVVRLETGFT
jgi:hypothetical protein